MNSREVTAIFSKGEVLVPKKEEAESLLQSGYGTVVDDVCILSKCETLYLIAEKRLRVSNAEETITFQSLLESFRIDDPEIWTRYIVFMDLRSRGYVVKEGIGNGIDFRVYERGMYHVKVAKYFIFAICEGNPIPAERLGRVLRMVQTMKKTLIVAVVDRRGEIVYYSISMLNLGLRLNDPE